MKHAIVARIAYFGAVFALGFVLGVLRTVLIAPLLGELAAVAIELPIILGFAWVVSGWLIHRLQVPAAPSARLAMGGLAFALLMLGEVSISVGLAGRNLGEHFALYRDASHLLGLAGQVAFALFPALRRRT